MSEIKTGGFQPIKLPGEVVEGSISEHLSSGLTVEQREEIFGKWYRQMQAIRDSERAFDMDTGTDTLIGQTIEEKA
jgi:hypothetical protein